MSAVAALMTPARRILVGLGSVALVAALAVSVHWPRPEPIAATGEGNSITAPDTEGTVGFATSLALDAAGNPVVSYWDYTNSQLKLLHCNDPNCAGEDESITAPDAAGNFPAWTALALDGAGNPVVSYYDSIGGNLTVLHCNDPNCAGGDESIAAPDTEGDVGLFFTDMELDAAGNPVVSYYDWGQHQLKLLHCGNPNCTAGNSIFAPDTEGNVGSLSGLALDAAGNPVVSYWDSTNVDLKVLHCGNPNCTAGNSIAAPDGPDDVGSYTSLALDAAGNPVVSYYDETNDQLKVLHCNDPNCTGGDESIVAADEADEAGTFTSLVLDAAGNPVVSYCLEDPAVVCSEMRVLHCGDPNCTAGNSIVAPDIGYFTSLALDAAGNPVVSYYDNISTALKVLHCGDPNCSGVQPPISTPTTTPTPTPTAAPCPPEGCPVGGIAELPDLAGTPLEAGDSSRPRASVVAGVAAAVMAGALVLGGGAWYARRRRGAER